MILDPMVALGRFNVRACSRGGDLRPYRVVCDLPAQYATQTSFHEETTETFGPNPCIALFDNRVLYRTPLEGGDSAAIMACAIYPVLEIEEYAACILHLAQ